MPLYYFHISYAEGFAEDPEGQDLADDAAARAAAVEGARSLMAEDILHGKLSLSSSIIVENEHHELLFAVSFDEAVEIER